jgi:hypothetical protein
MNTGNPNQPGEDPNRDGTTGNRPSMSEGDIQQAFAGLALAEQDTTSDDVVTINRPGFTETSGGGVSLVSMSPEQQAAGAAKSDEDLRQELGRTLEDHERLRAEMDEAKIRYDAAKAEDERARREEPGSDAQLAALKALESAKDAYMAAMHAFITNNSTPIVRHTPEGTYKDGVLQQDETTEN